MNGQIHPGAVPMAFRDGFERTTEVEGVMIGRIGETRGAVLIVDGDAVSIRPRLVAPPHTTPPAIAVWPAATSIQQGAERVQLLPLPVAAT